MRIDRGWLVAGFVPALLAGLLAPPAWAAVPLGGGSGITVNGTPCTLATIGHDRSGELVGLTSAHCGGPGAQVAADGAAGTVGTVESTNDGLDYALIKFDPASVTPVANVDGFPINGIGGFPPGLFQPICGQSSATGHGCTNHVTAFPGWPALDPASVYVGGCRNPADQGTPVTANDLLIGMVRNSGPPITSLRCNFAFLPNGGICAEIVSIPAILDDLNAKGGPGAGFAPV
ncbi:MAG TPA: serine protease [Mycobacterium sp.]|nr:serine protease [Mycobacterium sp.]